MRARRRLLLGVLAVSALAGCGGSSRVDLKDSIVIATAAPGSDSYTVFAVPLAGGKAKALSDRKRCGLGPRVSASGKLSYLEAATCAPPECPDGSTGCTADVWTLMPDTGHPRALSFVTPPRGDALAVLHRAARGTSSTTLTLESGGKKHLVGGVLPYPSTIAWAPSGKELAFTPVKGSGAALYDAHTKKDTSTPMALATADGAVRILTHPHDEIDTALGWSADGKLIAFVRTSTLDQAVQPRVDLFVYDVRRHAERKLARLGAVGVILDPFTAEVTLWGPKDRATISLRTGKRRPSPFANAVNPNPGNHPITPVLFMRGNRVILREDYVGGAPVLDLARRNGQIVRRLVGAGSQQDEQSSLVDGSWISAQLATP